MRPNTEVDRTSGSEEKNEKLARCAALYKFGEEGDRPLTWGLPIQRIFENDEFGVRAR